MKQSGYGLMHYKYCTYLENLSNVNLMWADGYTHNDRIATVSDLGEKECHVEDLEIFT